MDIERSGEFFLLDRSKWEEFPDKKVQASGYIYVGNKYQDVQVRVFYMKEGGRK